MVKTKEQSLWKALLFSFLSSLGFAVLWGVVYSIGFIAYIVAVSNAVASYTIFMKFYKKVPFWSVLWVIFFAFLFTEIALLISCALIIVSVDPTISFGESFGMLLGMIETMPELSNALLTDTIVNGVLIVISSILIKAIMKYKEAKTQVLQQQDNSISRPVVNQSYEVSSQQNFNQNTINANYDNFNNNSSNVVNTLPYVSCEVIKNEFILVVDEYSKTKDKITLEQKLSNLKAKYQNLSQFNKNDIIMRVQSEMQNENLRVVEKVALKTILKSL
ncbi:MAG: hypothetical protein J6C13_00470 [Clostridia bacterium]|nr:hypothetical protein [Clostridia bacterium]